MNKSVKNIRTTDRNRQLHQITSAFVELRSYYSTLYGKKISNTQAPNTCKYIEIVKAHLEKIQDEDYVEDICVADFEDDFNNVESIILDPFDKALTTLYHESTNDIAENVAHTNSIIYNASNLIGMQELFKNQQQSISIICTVCNKKCVGDLNETYYMNYNGISCAECQFMEPDELLNNKDVEISLNSTHLASHKTITRYARNNRIPVAMQLMHVHNHKLQMNHINDKRQFNE